jgi:hypothetical protein
MSKDLSKNIIDKIKDDKIEPKAKWNFILKDSFIWIFFIVSIVVGSLAVSVIIHLVKIDLNSFAPVDANFARKIGLLIPYTWLIFLSIFILVAYFNLKNTKKGYKVNPYLLITMSIVLSVIIGVTGYAFGAGRSVEKTVYQKLPIYKTIFDKKMGYWHDPESGRLMGVVVDRIDEDYYLIDIAKEKWLIHYSEELPFKTKIRLIGEMIEKGEFRATNHLDSNIGKFRMPLCERKGECMRSMR